MTTNNTTPNTTPDISNIEGIKQAIASNTNPALTPILEALLQAKIREAELLAKKSSTSKFNADEAILKSVFVAIRPHIRIDKYDCSAVKAFNAVLQVLPITFSKELQKSLFSTSILHCGKSNMNKAKNTDEALNSYGEAVKQAMRILPSINANEWDAWYYEMKEAKTRADKKHSVPVEPVQEPVQPEPVQEPVQPDKKTIITTRKQGNKRK